MWPREYHYHSWPESQSNGSAAPTIEAGLVDGEDRPYRFIPLTTSVMWVYYTAVDDGFRYDMMFRTRSSCFFFFVSRLVYLRFFSFFSKLFQRPKLHDNVFVANEPGVNGKPTCSSTTGSAVYTSWPLERWSSTVPAEDYDHVVPVSI